MDELEDRGWIRVDRLVTHKPGGQLVYDGRGLPAKRAYLQCLLAIDVLFRLKITEFRSDRQQGFYQLLLHGRQEAHDARGYKNQLQDLPGDPPALRDLMSVVKRPRLRPPDVAVEGPASPSPEYSISPVGVVASPGDEGDGDSDHPAPIGDPGPDVPGLPAFIDGGACVHDTAGDKDGLRLYCKFHKDCQKYRSRRLDPYGHGARAVEFYLGAWMERGRHIPEHLHHLHRGPPTRAEVEAYAASHG